MLFPHPSPIQPMPSWDWGADEVGRGAYAGPIIIAIAALPPDLPKEIRGLARDSKQLSPHQRANALNALTAHGFFRLGGASTREIDALGPGRATMLAIERAFRHLPVVPEHIRMDGTEQPRLPTRVSAHIGGDRDYPAIAAASIIAKQVRDALMGRLDRVTESTWGFEKNKGYGTAAHTAALDRHGPSWHHRALFLRSWAERPQAKNLQPNHPRPRGARPIASPEARRLHTLSLF